MLVSEHNFSMLLSRLVTPLTPPYYTINDRTSKPELRPRTCFDPARVSSMVLIYHYLCSARLCWTPTPQAGCAGVIFYSTEATIRSHCFPCRRRNESIFITFSRFPRTFHKCSTQGICSFLRPCQKSIYTQ